MKISRALLLSLSIAAISPFAINAEGELPLAAATKTDTAISFASTVWGYTGEVLWAKTGLAVEALKLKTAIEKLGGLEILKDRDAGTWLIANSDTVGRVTLLTTAALVAVLAYNKYASTQKDTTPNFDVYFDDEYSSNN